MVDLLEVSGGLARLAERSDNMIKALRPGIIGVGIVALAILNDVVDIKARLRAKKKIERTIYIIHGLI